jgi:OPA family sugar phosphate sensor protein UhpC-like MFS transporter
MRFLFSPDYESGEHLSEEEQKKYYSKLKWHVFLSATIGYGLYYVCRLCLNVIKTPLVKEGILSETELGIVGSALFFSYAIGKFVNGFLADRVNIQLFMSLGLLLSALMCLVLGFKVSFVVFTILWALNGWFQSMGAPSSVIAITRWFDGKERGSFYGFWSASHNIGESITFIVISFVVTAVGWQWGFWGASIFGIVGAIIIFSFLYNSPESKGIYHLQKQKSTLKNDGSVASQQLAALKNPLIWILALSSSFMYISRYAINSWGVFYLENAKGFSIVEASSIISISSVCGIIGTILSGFVSDKFFKGNRNVPALLFGILNTLAITLFMSVSKEHVWLYVLSMVIFGISIGGLVCFLGGLMAVDIAPKKATGAALGIVGVASYVGAGLQDIISGKLIEGGKSVVDKVVIYDFTAISFFWIGSALLSMLLCLLIWGAKAKVE